MAFKWCTPVHHSLYKPEFADFLKKTTGIGMPGFISFSY